MAVNPGAGQSPCPNCGRCPYCGRSDKYKYPYRPYQYPYPSYPYQPQWYSANTSVSSDTNLLQQIG